MSQVSYRNPFRGGTGHMSARANPVIRIPRFVAGAIRHHHVKRVINIFLKTTEDMRIRNPRETTQVV